MQKNINYSGFSPVIRLLLAGKPSSFSETSWLSSLVKCLFQACGFECEHRKCEISNKPKILLVEDTPLCQRVARFMLETLGFRVQTASTGQEAIDLYNETFSAVLLDIGLPDIDGYTVCQQIRAIENHHHHVPIIACTAFDLSLVREQCLAVGMDDVMNKPTSVRALQEKLSVFIRF